MNRLNHFQSLGILILLLSFFSCDRPSEGSRKAGEHIKNTITASLETQQVNQKKNEDAADDPAIWIHPENPSESVIFGTAKQVR